MLLLGAPGSGKGTQTSKLLSQFSGQINSIASGDLLRKQVAQRTEVGLVAESYMKSGRLIPDKVMVELIKNDMKTNDLLHSESSWLLDGFPRNYEQALELYKVLSAHNCGLNMVVELDVDQSVILERIEARWVHIPSGRVYNLDYNPPKVPFKDDVTGEDLSKREDDTAAVFQKRLDQYNEEIEPLKEFYAQRGILHKVSGNSSDIIFPQLSELVLKLFGRK